MIIKKYWREIVIILLFIFMLMIWHTLRQYKADNIRLKNNYEALANNKPHENFQSNELLTRKEFKVYFKSLIDTIMKKIDVKPKQITNVTNVYQTYNDTVNNYYSTPVIGPGIFNISYVDTCWGFTGLFNSNDTTVHISDKWFTNDIHIVDYWKRNPLFNIRWFPKIGHKEYYRETIDNCSSKYKVEKIKIKKDE